MSFRSYIKKIVSIAAICFTTLIICEIALAIFTAKQHGSFQSAAELNRIYLSPIFSSPGVSDCAWGESVGPHPYIGYFYSKHSDCPTDLRNNYGFKGQAIPHVYDNKFYTLMIVGGSVAEQMGVPLAEQKLIFEKVLNEKYVSPNGKPFKVLNFSMAGSHQPVAFITVGLFIDRVDEVVAIEGYNEARHIIASAWLENPPSSWLEIAAAQYAPLTYAGIKLSIDAMRISSSTPLKYSYTIFYSLKSALNLLLSRYKQYEYSSNPFADPYDEIPGEIRDHVELNGYVKFADNIAAISLTHKKPATIFLQPYPQKYKELTFEEKSYIANVNFDTNKISSVYSYLINNSKASVISLENIFGDAKSSIYVDDIHLNVFGIKIMSESIADALAKKGRWKKRIHKKPDL